jgi:peptidoglycan/xylan/chitin deacetylase (PgdA/CDA1 family)
LRGAAPAAGIIAFLTATVLAAIHLPLAAVPLTLFVLACAAAPFLPACGFFLPVTSRGRTEKRQVALTFDDGPDPATTPFLLRILADRTIPATFFVTGEKADTHPDLMAAILAGGHTVGNHTHRHDPLIMLKSDAALEREIGAAQDILSRQGVRPLAFRPVAGITNPRLDRVLRRSGLFAVTFNCRAVDFGNRRIRHLSGRIRRRLRPGAILLLHDTPPPDPERLPLWQTEIIRTLNAVEKAGYTIVDLADLIGRPVMAPAGPPPGPETG